MKPIPLAESSIDRTERAQRWLGLVSLFAAVISTVFAASFTFLKSGIFEGGNTTSPPPAIQSQHALTSQVEALRTEIKALRADAAKAATQLRFPMTQNSLSNSYN